MEKGLLKKGTICILLLITAIYIALFITLLFEVLSMNWIIALIILAIPFVIYKSMDKILKYESISPVEKIVYFISLSVLFLIIPVVSGVLIPSSFRLVISKVGEGDNVILLYFATSSVFNFAVVFKDYNIKNKKLIKSSLSLTVVFMTIIFTFMYDLGFDRYINLLIGNFVSILLTLSIIDFIDYYKEG